MLAPLLKNTIIHGLLAGFDGLNLKLETLDLTTFGLRKIRPTVTRGNGMEWGVCQ